MAVTYWVFDLGGTYTYTFPRNPDRFGGDTYWIYEGRVSEQAIVGSNIPNIQIDGHTARRTIRFSAITGVMMRTLQNFYLRQVIITNCRDHLLNSFSCFIVEFVPVIRPTTGNFPGSYEDTWNLELTMIKMS